MRQDPNASEGRLTAGQETAGGTPARRKAWLRRIWKEGNRGEKESALWVFSRLQPADAVPFFREVMASGETRLWEKKRVRDLLCEIDPEADVGEDTAHLDAAWFCVENTTRAGKDGDGAHGGESPEMMASFFALPRVLQGAVAVELLERDPDRAIPFLERALEEKEPLWEEVLVPLAETPHKGAAALIRNGYRRTDDKPLRKKMKKLNHKRRARGMPTFPLEGDEDRRVIWAPPTPVRPTGLLSITDSPDSRMVWVLRQNIRRGMLVFTGWLHDRQGMRNFLALELSRTEAEKYRESVLQNPDLPVVEADPGYCAYLLDEAYKRGAPVEGAAEAYRNVRMLLKELLPPGGEVPSHPIHGVFTTVEGGGSRACCRRRMRGSWSTRS